MIAAGVFAHSMQVLSIKSEFLLTNILLFFVLVYHGPCTLFSYFSALTRNGFACHVKLVTDCVMDGILVRALLCLRHTVGQKHPATSHITCHAPHPAHVTLYY